MSDHAELGPSAAERWVNCPGSVVLCEGMESVTSSYADEGTKAHGLGEAMLTNAPFLADDEMREHVSVYVRYVESLCKHRSSNLHVESRVKVNDDIWGTADAIVWDPSVSQLHVVDLKYGAGIPVEVKDNLQLKIYALAALLTHKYPAKTICVAIAQPRIPHVDGLVRTVEFDAVDLLDFYADLKDAVARIDDAIANKRLKDTWAWQEQFLHPTDKGCKWCLASATCPKVKAKAQQLAKQVFSPVTAYDPKALASTLDFLPILEGWIKNVREFAYAEAEKGHDIPDYKLVPKRADRKWKPGIQEDLAKALKVSEKDLYGPAPMKGVTDIQKMAPGKNDEQRAKVLEPFVTKESTGHTLVHASDKREAIKVDAKSAFAPALANEKS